VKIVAVAIGILASVASLGSPAFCQEKPDKVSLCEIARDPAAYNHKLLEVTGLVSHGFEVFNLSDPTCSSSSAIWLEYGGKSMSGTTYCCGVAPDRHRSKELVVEGIRIPLIKDRQFLDFDKLIQPPFRSGETGATVHATLVGRLFAGQEMHTRNGAFWGGYGHMGCCSLFAIQQVKAVSPADSK
jgi:hypothetical protein